MKMTWDRGVGADSFPQVRGELGEILVGHHHRQPVGAGLGEHVLQRVGEVEEVLALVDKQAGIGEEFGVNMTPMGVALRAGRRPAALDHPPRPTKMLAEQRARLHPVRNPHSPLRSKVTPQGGRPIADLVRERPVLGAARASRAGRVGAAHGEHEVITQTGLQAWWRWGDCTQKSMRARR